MGIHVLGDLYEDGVLLPYQTLQDWYDLPRGDYLLHSALVMAVQKHWKEGLAEPHTNMVCKYVVMAAGTFKAVTGLYRRMLGEGTEPLEELQRKWEADLGKEIQESAWAQIVRRAWKSTRNARFQLVHFFVLHRAYLTPAKIKKYFNINTAQCPRCTLEGAEFEHMMWSFPQLGTYWEEVGNLLRKITDRQMLI